MTETALPFEITPQEVQRRLDAGEKLALIDVREPHEFQLARIAGAELVPMRTVPAELARLDEKADDAALNRLLPSRRAQFERGPLAAGAGSGRLPEHGGRH